MKEMKRILSLVMCLVMLVGILPVNAFATETGATQSTEATEAAPMALETEETETTETPTETTVPSEPEGTTVPSEPEGTTAPAESSEPTETTAPAESSEPTETTEATEATLPMLPNLIFGSVSEEAKVADTPTVVAVEPGYTSAAIFGSDIHDTSISGILSGIAGSGVTYNTATFVGDTFSDTAGSTSNVTSSVVAALGDQVECFYVWGDHDNKSDVPDDSGLVYEGDHYIYVISMADMDNDYSAEEAAAEMAEFTAAVEDMDKTKPLFIASHQPLHARRSDNIRAQQWTEVINAAGEQMDIVFFWGHNHTGDGTTDQNVYYVSKGSTLNVETVNGKSQSAAGTSSSDTGVDMTINFTYMNAGYMGKSAGRGNMATTVLVYDDELVFQDYNSSGAYTGTNSHNVTIEREFEDAVATPTVNTITVPCTYDGTENLDTVTAKGTGLTAVSAEWNDEAAGNAAFSDCVSYDVALTGYTENDTVDLTFCIADMTAEDLVVYVNGTATENFTATENEDGSLTVALTQSAAKATYIIGYAAVAADAAVTGIAVTTMPDITNYTLMVDNANDGNLYLDITGLVITATYDNGETAEIEWDRFDETTDGYSLTFDLTTVGTKTVTVTYGEFTTSFEVTVHEFTAADNSEDETVVNAVSSLLKSGYVSRDITLTEYTDGTDVKVVMPAPEGADTVYYVAKDGTATKIDGAEFADGYVTFITNHFSTYVVGEIAVPDPETVTGSGTITTTTKKTVYVLTSSISSGNEYLIVNGNSAGSYYALANNSGSVAATGVTVKTDSEIGTYIELDDATDELWTTSGSSSTSLKNGNYYLGYTGSNNNRQFGLGTNARNWTYSNNRLSIKPGNTTYYLRYNSGWTWTNSNSDSGRSVYFYVPTEVEVETTTPANGTYSIVGNPANATVAVVKDEKLTLGSTLTFTADSGAVNTTTNPSGAVYTEVTGGDPSDIMTVTEAGVVTFTGNEGKALVQVSYDTNGDTAGGIVTNYITITATKRDYKITINITDTDENGKEYTTPAAGTETVKEGTSLDLSNTVITYVDGNGKTQTVSGADIEWTVSGNASIANGVVTAGTNPEGSAESEATITASWVDHYGNTITDTLKLNIVEAIWALDLCEPGYVQVTITEFADGVTYYTKNEDGTYTAVTGDYDADTTYYVSGYISIKDTIVVKEVGSLTDKTYDLWAVITKDKESIGTLTAEQQKNLTFISSDESIATVDSTTGVVTYTGKEGTVSITAVYTYDTENGKSVTDTVTFSISGDKYYIEQDGTDDFPEFPDPGSIRIDKTAQAVGNFSQTGTALVELSMTGVPYGSSVPTDVVVMMDMTTSMSNSSSVDDAQVAIQNMLEALVYDEENKTYDSNIYIQVWSFKSDNDGVDVAFENNLTRRNITSAAELTAAKNAIDTGDTAFDTSGNSGNGTCYDEATKKMESIVSSCTTKNIVAVFASDGEPTRYAYLNSSGSVTEIPSGTQGQGGGGLDTSDWFNTDGSTTGEYLTEYYTYLLKSKNPAIPVYTVGINISDNTNAAWILEHMSSEYDALGTSVSAAPANATTDYFFTANANTTSDDLSKVFGKIASSIKEAATNVVVQDEIGNDYTLAFAMPLGVDSTKAGMEDFYIQVVGYELDENNERGEYTVLENFTFGADGALKSHTIGTTLCTGCDHVTLTNNSVTEINGTYFTYVNNGEKTDKDGNTYTEEFVTWKANKLDRTELALQYFAHLDNSTGTDAADQVEAGTYYTNEEATITYTNFNGRECKQYFPVPSMTWKGAKVTYVFYLVNQDGQPVNSAGKVIPFAESIYVTDPVTYDVTWNNEEGSEKMLAQNLLASANVPDVYTLYDDQAYYEIRVYQTEGVDDVTKAVNYNYFKITGASDKLIDSAMDTDTTVNNCTTKVYNTKSGTKYDKYGVYSEQNVGTVLNTTDAEGKATTVTTTVKTDDIDYSNTTVAFAVMWIPAIVEDTVVVDYGLDVVINVTGNDSLASGVVGVRADAPDGVVMGSGQYRADKNHSADIYIDADDENGLKIGTATVESLTSVRFSMDKTNGMQFNEPAVFYYESDVNFYDDNVLNTTSMYSKVTVIPATTVYYEDSFLTLASFTKTGDTWPTEADKTTKWTVEGTTASATQDQDRPGASQISAALDADNVYGYDSAYTNMSTHSLNSSAKITVDPNTRGEATFTFYGTGFDVIGLTSNTTGTLTVQVYSGAEATGTAVKTSIVDTYYGMEEDGTLSKNTPEAIYQVPVMKIFGLNYGQYTVKIVAGYNTIFDHDKGGSYDLYLDAIRIYDPTGNENTTANNAYIADGEAYPVYEELRDNILSVDGLFKEVTITEFEDGVIYFTKNNNGGYDRVTDEWTTDGTTYYIVNPASSFYEDENGAKGAVFIDCNDATTSIADYISYGPNNELYLASGQAIAFEVDVTATMVDIQLGMKVANGESVTYTIQGAKQGGNTITTTTDMYYSIWDYAKDGGVVVIKNTSGGILSLTNIKATFNTATSTNGLVRMTPEGVSAAVKLLRTTPVADVPETTEPNTSEPESSEPDASEPETTEPEVTEPEATEPETTVPEVTEPETETETVVETVVTTVKKLVERFKSFLNKWFR